MTRIRDILLVALLSPACLLASDYYVSPAGNDGNPGIGPDATQAWQSIAKVNATTFTPGDRILFQGEQTFAGTLALTSADSGSAGNVVTVTSYGTGRAVIHGGTGNGITLNGCSYVRVANINVVGMGRKDGNNRGVGILPTGASHVEITEIDVSGFQRAGLEFRGCNNLQITYVDAHANGYAGISSGPESAGLSTAIRVAHCRAFDNPGDPTVNNNHSGNGIVFYRVNDSTIEYCEAFNNGYDQPDHGGGGPVGIWGAYCRRVVIQYCISHNNKSSNGVDGGGFDWDGGTHDCILQYNYSYDNQGTGYLLYTWSANQPCSGNIVRYNISENDGQTNHFNGINYGGGDWMTNIQIYNNIVYNSQGRHGFSGGWDGGPSSSTTIRNNIFIINGSGNYINDLRNGVAQGNLYWNTSGSGTWEGRSSLEEWRAFGGGREMLNGNPVGIHADPQLGNPGGGEKLTDPTMLSLLSAYRLAASSPAINAGLDLQALFGQDPGTKDLFGTDLPQGGAFDIGAHEVNQGAFAPAIVSSAPSLAYVGVLFSYAIQASGSPAPTFTASNLPSWMNLSGSILSGTPTAAGTTGVIRVTAINSQGEGQQTFQLVVSDSDPSLIGHWKLDETSGTVAADASAQSNSGTLAGNATWLPTGGVRLGALDFTGYDGSDDAVSVMSTAALQGVQANSYSLAAWVRADSTPAGSGAANDAAYGIILKAGGHLGLSYRADQKYEFDHWLSSGALVSVVSAMSYAPGSFHQVTGVLDRVAGVMTLHVDGQPAGTTNFAANDVARDYGTTPWHIGIAQPGAGTYRWAMDGAIDDVRIYNRALSEAEVLELARRAVDPAMVISHYGQQQGDDEWNANADANGDGQVDAVDLGLALRGY